MSCRSVRPANGVRGGSRPAWSVGETYRCTAARIEASRHRVSGVEPTMVRYRLGGRRGGNGRRGGPVKSLGASPYQFESGRRYRRSQGGLAGFPDR